VDQQQDLYSIRISGHLGPTALSAFPSMVSQLKGEDTLLTGVLDRSALYGVLAEIEALVLDLIELRLLERTPPRELTPQARARRPYRDPRTCRRPPPW
jgi:hypothetical protein